jgi:hypothetical protein
MMHVGNYTTEKSNWTSKRTKHVYEMREHIQKQLQKYSVPGINTATVGFKGKIIFKTYDPKN